MHHQSTGSRVEARSTTGATTLPALRAAGDDFDAVLRDVIRGLATDAGTRESWRQLLYDFNRGRSVSVATAGALLAACAASPTLPVDRYDDAITRLCAWMRSLRPTPAPAIRAAWAHETECQAPADIAQAQALSALETGDVAAVDRAIDATTRHVAATAQLLTRLEADRRTIRAARRARPCVASTGTAA